MRAGSVWAMSGTSGEALAAVVRQVLSVRGPMAEDDLLGVRPSKAGIQAHRSSASGMTSSASWSRTSASMPSGSGPRLMPSASSILLGVRTNLLFGSGRRRLVAMKKHSIEAQRLLGELDAELAANGAAAGRSLGWSASERQIISMAADAIDRGVELAAAYAEAVDVKDKIKVSREIRLQEMATTRLLSKVSTAVPAPESLRSIKARNAVNKRWHPDAG